MGERGGRGIFNERNVLENLKHEVPYSSLASGFRACVMSSVPLSVQTAGSAVKKATETLVSAAQQASVQVDDDSGKIKVSL